MKFILQLSLIFLASGNPVSLLANDTAVHFEYYQRVIFLHVQVNNSDSLLFLFDTGANASAIDAKTADKLKLPRLRVDTVEGSAGNLQVQMVNVSSVKAGNSTVKNLVFTKQDLSFSLAPPGKHIDGILGTDFLRHFVITLDFKKQQISFSEHADNDSESIPFEMDNGIPRIKATINNTFHTFLRYDSGSSLFATDSTYINVTTDDWIAIRQKDTTLKPSRYFRGVGTGGELKLAVVSIKSFSFNGHQIQNAFIIVQPKLGYFARPDAVGFLGNNLLEKYDKVVVDFPANIIYLLRRP